MFLFFFGTAMFSFFADDWFAASALIGLSSPLQKLLREMGTSFRHNDFWDHFGGQALLMIGLSLP